jgi:hypothetical protein
MNTNTNTNTNTAEMAATIDALALAARSASDALALAARVMATVPATDAAPAPVAPATVTPASVTINKAAATVPPAPVTITPATVTIAAPVLPPVKYGRPTDTGLRHGPGLKSGYYYAADDRATSDPAVTPAPAPAPAIPATAPAAPAPSKPGGKRPKSNPEAVMVRIMQVCRGQSVAMSRDDIVTALSSEYGKSAVWPMIEKAAERGWINDITPGQARNKRYTA